MADHGLPTLTSTYSDFLSQLDARLDDLAKMLDEASLVNLPVGAIRWDTALNTWRKWSGSSWSNLTTGYSININGTVGATTPSTGSFTTLTSSSTTSLAANTTIGGVAAVTISGTQTLTNKTLTSPVISSISNTGTLTLPTTSDTLVGRATTDTLTNKTLTAPKFADGGFIADPNANEVLRFSSVAGAINYVDILNSVDGAAVQIRALGDSTNIALNLVGKGTGQVTINGIAAADISTAQTLTNKTIGSGSSWSGQFNVVGTADANLLFVNVSTDRVGLGTNNPLAKLHVNTTSGNSNARFTNGTVTTEVGTATGNLAYFGTISNHATRLIQNGTTGLEISSGLVKIDNGYGSLQTFYGCRAWVNFDGTSGSIGSGRASGNVSSVTDNGTGSYTVNFTNSMPDANYATVISASGGGGTYNNATSGLFSAGSAGGSGTYTAGAVQIWFSLLTNAGSGNDREIVNVAIFR